MTTRLDDATTTADPVVRGIVVVTMAIVIVGVLALIRAAIGGSGVDHVTVRIDNQAGLAVQVHALDASGDRVGLGEAEPRTLTTFQEIPTSARAGRWSPHTRASRSTGKPWPGPRWPPSTGRPRSPPARPARLSGLGSSDRPCPPCIRLILRTMAMAGSPTRCWS
jgi:hypothetical protein